MLRRRCLSALVSAVLFLFAGTAEATGVHRCPHHDVLPGAAAASHDVAHAQIHGSDHATHAAPDAGEPADHDGCTCMGACQPAGVAAPPESGAATIVPGAEAIETADGWSTPEPRATHVPFALPFANAPPVR